MLLVQMSVNADTVATLRKRKADIDSRNYFDDAKEEEQHQKRNQAACHDHDRYAFDKPVDNLCCFLLSSPASIRGAVSSVSSSAAVMVLSMES